MSLVFINYLCFLGHFNQYNHNGRKTRCPLNVFLLKYPMLLFSKWSNDYYNYLWSYSHVSSLHHLSVVCFLKYWIDSQKSVEEPIKWSFGHLSGSFVLVHPWWVIWKKEDNLLWLTVGWFISSFLSSFLSSLNMETDDWHALIDKWCTG